MKMRLSRQLLITFLLAGICPLLIAGSVLRLISLESAERLLALAAAAGLLTAIAQGWAFSLWKARALERSTRSFEQAMRAIVEGDVSVRITQSDCAETAAMASAFNHMAE